MQCYVYKGANKSDHYLYLPMAQEDLMEQQLPAALLEMLGELSLVIEFELTHERKLPQADAEHVINDMSEQGFYLQMPKKDMLAEESRWFN